MVLLNEPITLTSLGRKIRAARRLADLHQAELAEACGVSRSAVNQWEMGRTEPSASKLFAVARATKQPLDWFAEGLDSDDLRARRDSNPQPSDWELDPFWTVDRTVVWLEFWCQDTPDSESTHSGQVL